MNDRITVDQAATLAKVATKTIRRYIQNGRLPAETIKGARGQAYSIKQSDVERIFAQADPDQKPKPRTPALSTLEKKIEDLQGMITGQTAEIRDLRGQVNQLHEQLRALPAPGGNKQTIWQRLGIKKKG